MVIWQFRWAHCDKGLIRIAADDDDEDEDDADTVALGFVLLLVVWGEDGDRGESAESFSLAWAFVFWLMIWVEWRRKNNLQASHVKAP